MQEMDWSFEELLDRIQPPQASFQSLKNYCGPTMNTNKPRDKFDNPYKVARSRSDWHSPNPMILLPRTFSELGQQSKLLIKQHQPPRAVVAFSTLPSPPRMSESPSIEDIIIPPPPDYQDNNCDLGNHSSRELSSSQSSPAMSPALSTFYSPLYSPAVSVATEPSSPWFRPELDLAKQTSSFYEESPRSPAFEQWLDVTYSPSFYNSPSATPVRCGMDSSNSQGSNFSRKTDNPQSPSTCFNYKAKNANQKYPTNNHEGESEINFLTFPNLSLQSRQGIEKLSRPIERFCNLPESTPIQMISRELQPSKNEVSTKMKKPIEIVNLNSDGFPVATNDSVFIVEEVIDVTVDMGNSSSLPLAEYLAEKNKSLTLDSSFQLTQAGHPNSNVNHAQAQPLTLTSPSLNTTLVQQQQSVFFINQDLDCNQRFGSEEPTNPPPSFGPDHEEKSTLLASQHPSSSNMAFIRESLPTNQATSSGINMKPLFTINSQPEIQLVDFLCQTSPSFVTVPSSVSTEPNPANKCREMQGITDQNCESRENKDFNSMETDVVDFEDMSDEDFLLKHVFDANPTANTSHEKEAFYSPRDSKTENSMVLDCNNSSPLKKYQCYVCGQEFIDQKNLHLHSKIHMEPRDYQCETCDKFYHTLSGLQAHQRNMHLSKCSGGNYVCPMCQKEFLTKFEMSEHKNKHHSGFDNRCKKCLSAFRTQSELKRHHIQHHSNRPYACPTCPHRSKTKEKMERHVQSHLTSKDFPCPYCDKKFAFKNSMNKHLTKKRCQVLKKSASNQPTTDLLKSAVEEIGFLI